MKYILSCSTMAFLLVLSGIIQADETVFYVSQDGNDMFSGRMASVDSQGKDGPFRHMEAALSAVAKYRKENPNLQGPVRIEPSEGIYYLEKTLVLDPSISGTKESPTIIRPKSGNRVVFSGGRPLTNWTVLDRGSWQLKCDDVQTGKWNFIQLFVNDQRRFRPRFPQEGTLTIADQIVRKDAKGKKLCDKEFKFQPGELKSDWKNPADIEVLVCHNWTMSRNLLESIDSQQGILTVAGSAPSPSTWGSFSKGHRYFLENVGENLSKPGQWYLDRSTGILTYLPMPGEQPDHVTVIAPRLEYLMNVTGEKNRYVENVIIENIEFAHTNWTTPKSGNVSPQAEVTVDSAIRMAGARSFQFIHCGFRNLGNYALNIGTACRDCRVERCEFKDIGAGGIRIGGDIYNTKSWPSETLIIPSLKELSREEQLTQNITITQCRLSYLGRLHPAAIGIWIGHAAHNEISENDIFDLYYSATSIGWVWGYGESLSHSNIVRNNEMHKIGQGFLSDMGAVYTLGISPGTKVTNNLIHDIKSFSYGGWGLYTDEGSSGIEMSFNIVYNTKSGGFHQHYGKENRIVNNIFVSAKDQQIQRTRMEKHLSFEFRDNIVYWTSQAPLFGSNWSDNEYKLDNNIYFNPNHEIRFAGKAFAEWQKEKKQDIHSIIADPMFVDPGRNDYRLKPESPAFKMGIKPISGPFGPKTPADILNKMPEPPVAFPLP